MAEIKLNKVCKFYGKIEAVKELSLTAKEKEFLVIFGPSGAGKTTILRLIAGLDQVTSGEIYFGDSLMNTVPPWKRDVAMTFEDYSLYSHFTIFDNLANPLKSYYRKVEKKQMQKRVKEIARMLGIDELLDRFPAELSGGQRQRVSLGRAIISQPKVLLLDEPLAHLDVKIRNQLRVEFYLLRQKLNTTTIYTTHDYREAVSIGDRVAVINQGELQQVGTPEEIYYEPANSLVASIIGWPQINLIRCNTNYSSKRLVSLNGGFSVKIRNNTLDLFERNKIKEVLLGIRPDKISFSREKSMNHRIEGRVIIFEPLSNKGVLYVCIGKENLSVLVDDPNLDVSYDEKVWLNFDKQALIFFDLNKGDNLLLKYQ